MDGSAARRVEFEESGEGRSPRMPLRRPGMRGDETAIALCDAVVDIVAALSAVPGREIRSRARESRAASQARHMAMYVSHVVLGLSMRQVGIGFGRDRTSIVYACHLIEDMRDDIEFDRLVAMVERVVGAAVGRRRSE